MLPLSQVLSFLLLGELSQTLRLHVSNTLQEPVLSD